MQAYRLRSDLILADRDERGRVVLKDPLNQKLYSFNAVTCDALQLLDGTFEPAELPERMRRAHGVNITPASVNGLIERARSLGLFDGEAPATPPPAPLAAIARFNPFYIRLSAVNPRPLLARVGRFLSPLLSRTAFALFVVVLAVSVVLLALGWRRYGNSFLIFGFFKQWILAWTMLTLLGVLHEIGHAVACERYGGKVTEAGFLLYLFQPGFYTNVNDAWMLPRGQRAVVALAGVYFEAWIYCACVVVWYFSRPFSTINQLAFILTVVLSSRIVANLFPFLRLDGYFLLADLLAVQNLRPKSIVYLASKVPLWGRSFRPARLPTRAERAIFVGYGVLSLASVAYALHASFAASRARWGGHAGYWVLVCMAVIAMFTTAYRYLHNHKTVLGSAAGRP